MGYLEQVNPGAVIGVLLFVLMLETMFWMIAVREKQLLVKHYETVIQSMQRNLSR